MPAFQALADGVLVSGQILPGDVAAAASRGVGRIVNNRPDDEEPGQPASDEIEAAARAAGLDYVHAPVRGLPDSGAVSAVAAALADGTPVLLFCRSGMRSAAAWAMAVAGTGGLSRDEILSAAAAAGYDLGRLPIQAPA